ncbi:DUF350 domain-containing protein [Paraconexibacter algicola]|uniref:DUF350 domain-containing protein n=1 Tax=Paraconexibacter algicola TaxID=2133960 RepID=A0A2T4UBP4_9ACTN|nr:DUF350 domain-containing protein [Paraconexibacter algicola]PTL54296.1 DUF350 domain-containing protein [Paraconexibacter algicola]
MDDFFTEIASALLYGAVGVALLAAGFLILDLLIPGKLGELIIEERNRSAGIITAAGMVAVGAVVTTAIASADGPLGEGLAETAGYGGVGVLMLGVAFVVVDVLTPGKLSDVCHQEGEQPVAYVIAAALLAAGAIVAAAIS